MGLVGPSATATGTNNGHLQMATLQKISCLSFDRRSEVTHSVLTLNRTRQVRRFLLRKRRKSISIYFLFGLSYDSVGTIGMFHLAK